MSTDDRIEELELKVSSLEEFQANLLARFDELLQTVDDLQLEVNYFRRKNE